MALIKDILMEIHEDQCFVEKLASLNQNFFNLKLEDAIRDCYIEQINKHNNPKFLALGEYPRGNRKRVDLGVCEMDKRDMYELRYTVEFKFMFSGDYTCFYEFPNSSKGFMDSVFRPDFERVVIGHQTDMFIMFISDWGDNLAGRSRFESKFIVPVNKLSQYQ